MAPLEAPSDVKEGRAFGDLSSRYPYWPKAQMMAVPGEGVAMALMVQAGLRLRFWWTDNFWRVTVVTPVYYMG